MGGSLQLKALADTSHAGVRDLHYAIYHVCNSMQRSHGARKKPSLLSAAGFPPLCSSVVQPLLAECP